MPMALNAKAAWILAVVDINDAGVLSTTSYCSGCPCSSGLQTDCYDRQPAAKSYIRISCLPSPELLSVQNR